jgi:hypothetical protein
VNGPSEIEDALLFPLSLAFAILSDLLEAEAEKAFCSALYMTLIVSVDLAEAVDLFALVELMDAEDDTALSFPLFTGLTASVDWMEAAGLVVSPGSLEVVSVAGLVDSSDLLEAVSAITSLEDWGSPLPSLSVLSVPLLFG